MTAVTPHHTTTSHDSRHTSPGTSCQDAQAATALPCPKSVWRIHERSSPVPERALRRAERAGLTLYRSSLARRWRRGPRGGGSGPIGAVCVYVRVCALMYMATHRFNYTHTDTHTQSAHIQQTRYHCSTLSTAYSYSNLPSEHIPKSCFNGHVLFRG